MKIIQVILFFIFPVLVNAQQPQKNKQAIDTSITDYDAIFSELELFIDSITTPASYGMFNLGVGNNFFNFQRVPGESLESERKITISPSLSYFHKTGFGVSGESFIIHDGTQLNPYQFSLTGFYDYLNNRKFITGLSYSKFFTKKDLSFYTSPLSNEAMVYFTYREHGIKPSVNFNYGWGSRESYSEQEEKVKNLRNKITVTTIERVADFNITTSLRYSFNWLNILSSRDKFRFTPQLSFISGTQQFGFNQVSNINTSKGGSGKNTSFTTENVALNDDFKFQPLSLVAFLKTEYSKGMFFVQPQVFFNYYFPAEENKLNAAFMLNAGLVF